MSSVSNIVGSITGSTSRDAAKESGAAERDATRQAIEAQEQAYREVAPGMSQFLAPQYQQAFQQSYLPEEFQQMPDELTTGFEDSSDYNRINAHFTGKYSRKIHRNLQNSGDVPRDVSYEDWGRQGMQAHDAGFNRQQVTDQADWESRKEDYLGQFGLGGGGGGGTGEYSDDPLSQLRAASGALGGEAQSNFFQNFQEDPGTQYRREQGMRSIDRQSSKMGGLGGGSRLKELSRFNQQLANEQLGNRLNQLGGLAQSDIGIGSNLANMRTGLAGAQAQGLQNMGTSLSNQYSNVAAAKNQGGSNMLQMGMMAAGFSDRRLKENIHKVGETNGLAVYKWDWRKEYEWLVKDQVPIGFIADEVKKLYPEAVQTNKDGFQFVNYSMILEQ